ncbi:MAG: DUF3037 domain-containing protein [Anaerolineales bacterium]|nr:DUF3037 domain-containing protein [Anaerolineales bacterium]MCB9127489.1 DUF3037 domain-containing protein [Ardenticatenales bacterium]
MHAVDSFDYAILRAVPRVERGEFINVGVILFCRPRRFLAARTALNEQRLAALGAACDIELLRQHLALIPRIAAGEGDAGPIAHLPLAERFHWLVAPRSAVLQPSPVHTGLLLREPQQHLDELFQKMVL